MTEDNQQEDDALQHHVVSVIATFTPDELKEFAKHTGATVEQWHEIIANWRAELH